jgi:hypothetical protein
MEYVTWCKDKTLLLLLLLLFRMLEIVLRVMQLRFISVVAMYVNFAVLLKD